MRRAGLSGIAGTLVSDPNRPSDVELSNKAELQQVDLGGKSEDAVISDLLAADAGYRDDLAYGLIPLPFGPGYNSNSYTPGLLQSVGLRPPAVRHNVPGYNKPVPPSLFRFKIKVLPAKPTGRPPKPDPCQDDPKGCSQAIPWP